MSIVSSALLSPATASSSGGSLTDAAAVAHEVYVLLHELLERKASAPVPEAQEPARLEGRAQQLADRARQLAQDLRQTDSAEALTEHLRRVGTRLEALRTALSVSHRASVAAAWRTAKCYEGLARQLRVDPAVASLLPELKPRNYARNAFHIFNGVLSGSLYTIFDDHTMMLWIAGIYTGVMVSTELARRLSPRLNRLLVDVVFGAIARPSEAWRMNSATWYGISILLMLLLNLPQVACVAAVLTLGFGDPAAAIVGKRFGRHKLVGNKTLEGALGFAAASTLVLLAWAALVQPAVLMGQTMPVLAALRMALVAGVTGAVTELVSSRVEDNFSIPLTVSVAVAFLGLP